MVCVLVVSDNGGFHKVLVNDVTFNLVGGVFVKGECLLGLKGGVTSLELQLKRGVKEGLERGIGVKYGNMQIAYILLHKNTLKTK